ncbi:TfoX family DNA transformation protein [Vibrio cincinnatiensis]|jgi:DNA transformation protein|uniref:Regulator of competence-specific genes n=1 Tax=Vibrio cincinnatiensis DSM 19608 TaxID=1123491 RepID=A0A1T4KG59_VIBCI|nr:TfoX/Sxy family DNA transformation protein [Vibrio cincinnatiensis]MCG3721977.1 TfoX family DNA transformation protein [Vibrio cincinnatiensis]MCG3724413.1 TfoX family DNA transformation protein [Vibrio cincinnatiensis]MCG3731210.1 TfoX family DNA transformation protein [Vibrio cincinnatiensis]MCG3736324.1 TfoX family DNA transformation protein [Vibrio cincinnatiensis]MCG3738723.1 TfoX family DNA transformation protein [Vibrio cincinnatiensis]
MDKPVLKDSMRLFEQLGRVKSRSMFGGFGVFVDDTMFALVVNDKLHMRANDELAEKFKQQGYQPYVYKKRGFPVVTKYFALPEACWDDPQAILHEAKMVLKIAQDERENQEQSKPERLKDLPNLRLATERMLKKAGINSVDQLHQKGALGAYKAIQQSHSTEVSLELLWALEGAIEGKHWSVIPHSRREELMKSLS